MTRDTKIHQLLEEKKMIIIIVPEVVGSHESLVAHWANEVLLPGVGPNMSC